MIRCGRSEHQTTGEGDLFRARLDQIINMKHELVQLAGKIDWELRDREIAPLYSDKGRSGIETRFVIGLLLLKHALCDEAVCERLTASGSGQAWAHRGRAQDRCSVWR
jgi:transposase, IS5 family